MKKYLKIIIGITILIFLLTLGLNKKINYFKYSDNTYIAVTIDGVESSSIPPKGNYKVLAVCDNATAIWNYDKWELNITSINGALKCALEFDSVSPVNLANHVMSLTNNDGIYNEPEKDYRYQGNNPNNFVSFNGELWRIIGVFSDNTHGKSGQNLVKIIKYKSIGAFSWHKYGYHNWPTSNLYNLLNLYYYTGQNETSGNYCNLYSSIMGSCEFAATGIIDSYYRNMIENVTWKLGAITTISDSGTMYAAERGTTVYTGNSTQSTGYIGLMYPSDYGYSVPASSCVRTTSLGSYNTNQCAGNSWFRGEGDEQVLTPRPDGETLTWYYSYTGNVYAASGSTGYAVRPVLYLKYDTKKLTGSGTSLDPYILVS